jgi:hypothetical protein
VLIHPLVKHSTPLVAHSTDVAFAVDVFGSAAVVCSAEVSNILDFGSAPESARLAVIALEPGACRATYAVWTTPCAAKAIALEYGALGGTWHMRRWRAGRWAAHRRRSWCRTLSSTGTEASLHEVGDEQLERAFDDGAEVTVRDGVPREVARELDVLLQCNACRKLDLVSPG